MNANQLRELIIRPTLKKIGFSSDNAEELLLFTCAVESDFGYYIAQVGGSALGIYQCEPDTHEDIWKNYIRFRPEIWNTMQAWFQFHTMPAHNLLMIRIDYATAVARIHYLRVKEALPNKGDIDGLWAYYKKYYNTESGKAEKEKSIAKYKRYVLGEDSTVDTVAAKPKAKVVKKKCLTTKQTKRITANQE